MCRCGVTVRSQGGRGARGRGRAVRSGRRPGEDPPAAARRTPRPRSPPAYARKVVGGGGRTAAACERRGRENLCGRCLRGGQSTSVRHPRAASSAVPIGRPKGRILPQGRRVSPRDPSERRVAAPRPPVEPSSGACSEARAARPPRRAAPPSASGRGSRRTSRRRSPARPARSRLLRRDVAAVPSTVPASVRDPSPTVRRASPKSPSFGRLLLVEEHVRRLEIAVDETARVEVREARRHARRRCGASRRAAAARARGDPRASRREATRAP